MGSIFKTLDILAYVGI